MIISRRFSIRVTTVMSVMTIMVQKCREVAVIVVIVVMRRAMTTLADFIWGTVIRRRRREIELDGFGGCSRLRRRPRSGSRAGRGAGPWCA